MRPEDICLEERLTMTVAQLDSLITLLRSRPAPTNQDVGRLPRTLREDGGLPGRRAGRQVRDSRCRRRAGRMGRGARLRCEPRGALPAWRRLRHRLDQHPSPARLRHFGRLRRARVVDRLSARARASLPGRGRRRGYGLALAIEAGLDRRQAGDRGQIRPAAGSPSPPSSTCATRSLACRPAPSPSRRGSISRASAPA